VGAVGAAASRERPAPMAAEEAGAAWPRQVPREPAVAAEVGAVVETAMTDALAAVGEVEASAACRTSPLHVRPRRPVPGCTPAPRVRTRGDD